MTNIRKLQRRLAERQGLNKPKGSNESITRSVDYHNPIAGLFLDDERKPSDVNWIRYNPDIRWQIVRDPSEFTKAIAERDYEAYSFDYYLGGLYNSDAGLDMLKKLNEKWKQIPPKLIPHMYFHSRHEDPSGDRRKNGAWIMERYWETEMFEWLLEQEDAKPTPNPTQPV
jgi:hypothetical protein